MNFYFELVYRILADAFLSVFGILLFLGAGYEIYLNIKKGWTSFRSGKNLLAIVATIVAALMTIELPKRVWSEVLYISKFSMPSKKDKLLVGCELNGFVFSVSSRGRQSASFESLRIKHPELHSEIAVILHERSNGFVGGLHASGPTDLTREFSSFGTCFLRDGQPYLFKTTDDDRVWFEQ